MRTSVEPSIARIEGSLREIVVILSRPRYFERVTRLAGLSVALDATERSLSRGQASVLAHIPESQLSELSALAVTLGLSKSTVSRALTELRELGLVRYGVSAMDRRSSIVRLTTRGRRVQRLLCEARCRLLAECLAEWPVDELSRLAQELQRLSRALADSARRPA